MYLFSHYRLKAIFLNAHSLISFTFSAISIFDIQVNSKRTRMDSTNDKHTIKRLINSALSETI